MGKCKQSTTAEALKNDFHFISIDLPGHGKTAPFESEVDYRIDRIAEWVNWTVRLQCFIIANTYS